MISNHFGAITFIFPKYSQLGCPILLKSTCGFILVDLHD